MDTDIERLWSEGKRLDALAAARAVLDNGDDEARRIAADALIAGASQESRGVEEAEPALRLAAELRLAPGTTGDDKAYAELPLARFLAQAGRRAEAEDALARCWQRAGGSGGAGARRGRDIAFELARFYLDGGRDQEAEDWLRRAAQYGEDARHSHGAGADLPLSELERLYRRQGRFIEAATVVEKRLVLAATRGPSVEEIELMGRRASLLRSGGRAEEALAGYRQALALAGQVEGGESAAAGRLWRDIGEVLMQLDRPDDAAAAWQRAAEILDVAYGEGHAEVVALRARLDEARPGDAPHAKGRTDR